MLQEKIHLNLIGKYGNAISKISNDYKYSIVAGTMLHMYCNQIFYLRGCDVVNFIDLTEILNKICVYDIEICV